MPQKKFFLMQTIISFTLLLSRKKLTFPPVYFFWTSYTEHFTYDTFSHQMCGFLSHHQAILFALAVYPVIQV